MNDSVFTRENIYFDETCTTQDEAFQFIANIAKERGYVKDAHAYMLGLHEREKEATTGFTDGVAIPHSKDDSVIKSGVFVVKFKNPIEWNSLDGAPVRVAIPLTIPTSGEENHLRILSLIARKLIDDDFRNTLIHSMDKEVLYNTIAQIEF